MSAKSKEANVFAIDRYHIHFRCSRSGFRQCRQLGGCGRPVRVRGYRRGGQGEDPQWLHQTLWSAQPGITEMLCYWLWPDTKEVSLILPNYYFSDFFYTIFSFSGWYMYLHATFKIYGIFPAYLCMVNTCTSANCIDLTPGAYNHQ